jgi:parvulin-like peptidyl-prolyl isomerase
LSTYLRDSTELSTPRIVSCLLLAMVLTASGNAQQPPSTSSATSSASSTPTPVKNVPPPSERVVLKVGNVQVTQADFETMVSDLEAQQGPADLSRQAIGDNYASLLMLSQQAVIQHLESSPEVVRQLALDRTQILSNAEYARLKAQAEPTPEEISAYYNAHLADYDVVQLRRLFIWTGKDGSKDGQGLSEQDATALAAAVRKAYASGSDVSKVVHEAVHDPNSVVFDTEPLTFQRGEMPPRLDEAAFALKEGGWTELNDAPGTFVFLQVVKRSRRDLKEVSPQIEKKLQAQKLKDEMSDLKKNAGIWMDEQYFAPPHSTQPKTSAQEKH